MVKIDSHSGQEYLQFCKLEDVVRREDFIIMALALEW